MEASQHQLTERGYELDREGQEAQNRANEAAVELERATARERANTERVSELEVAHRGRAAELESTRGAAGRHRRRARSAARFLETAAGEAKAFRQQVEARQQEARTAAEEVFTAERQLGASRRHAMHLMTQAGNARNHTAQAEESLAALEREAERLEMEMARPDRSGNTWSARAARRACALSPPRRPLKRLEDEIAALRESLQSQARRGEQQARTRSTRCAASRPP